MEPATIDFIDQTQHLDPDPDLPEAPEDNLDALIRSIAESLREKDKLIHALTHDRNRWRVVAALALRHILGPTRGFTTYDQGGLMRVPKRLLDQAEKQLVIYLESVGSSRAYDFTVTGPDMLSDYGPVFYTPAQSLQDGVSVTEPEFKLERQKLAEDETGWIIL